MLMNILAAIVLVALAMLALSVGLAWGRQPLQRSCGGNACLGKCIGCDRVKREQTP